MNVTVDLEPDRIRLSAGEQQIGDWTADECEIGENGAGGFVIRAEHDELAFNPDEPERFRHSLLTDLHVVPREVPTEIREQPAVSLGHPDQPPPRPLTLALFYLLVAVTTVLGVWALSTLV